LPAEFLQRVDQVEMIVRREKDLLLSARLRR
jgi:hypothetical protein